MIKKLAAVIVLVMVASLSVAGCTDTPSPKPEADPYSEIYDQTIGLKENSTFPPLTNESRFYGNFVVFDLSKNRSDRSSPVTDMVLYNESRHGPNRTVFFVNTTKLDFVGTYHGTSPGDSWRTWGAYSARFDIYAIKYPEKTPIGKYTIISDPPETSVGDHDAIGDRFDWKLWIYNRTLYGMK